MAVWAMGVRSIKNIGERRERPTGQGATTPPLNAEQELVKFSVHVV